MLFWDVLYHLTIVSSVYRNRRLIRALFPVVGSFLSLVMIVLLQKARLTCDAVQDDPGVPTVEYKGN